MIKVLPKELTRARELMEQAKFDEALEIIEKYEKRDSITQEDQLSALLIKGGIYLYNRRTRKALQTYEVAYQISQDLGLVPETIRTLIGKAYIGFIGNLDKASNYVENAERKLTSIVGDPSTERLRRDLLFIKSWTLLLKGRIKDAVESARECLRLTEEVKLGNKLDLAATYSLFGWIYNFPGKRGKALDYAMKSLEYYKELNNTLAIADNYNLIASLYMAEGEYDKALQYNKLSLSIEGISGRTKLNTLTNLGNIYYFKNEINRAIKYAQQALALAEELNITDLLINLLVNLGYAYRIIGKYSLAIEYFERCVTLSEKWGLIVPMATSISMLVISYIDENSREIANRYFTRLSELYNQSKVNGTVNISGLYLGAKAYMLKTSTRMRDRVEAQAIFKELIDVARGDALIYALGSLCDLLLEELSLYNDPKILDEIIPLITRSLEMAEKARNYYWLAETKLLQAKLALIQMKFEEGRRLMIEAQRIADLHGLNLLAWGISTEHDKLLEQKNVWATAKKKEVSLSERIKLASTDQVLERIQGKRTVETPKEVEEQSTVLLILAEGGVLVFSYPFSDQWRIDEDLFSSFLSAFSSFSTEFFSKGLDRAKFGDNTMLLESVGSFSFCYLFQGQTYLARKKLSKFTEKVQNNQNLWQDLEKHYKTGQILELKESPPLKSLITEIFSSNLT
ncbi:MAG: tetratricopeptide repeat protein [Candidatus Thorarchaeota archaeon]